MKQEFYKNNIIRVLQTTYLIGGFSLIIVLGSSLSYLRDATFESYADFIEFMLILGISTPSVLLLAICWGLFAYTKKNLIFAFLASIVSAIWYFTMLILLLYIRFTFRSKCGFAGYISDPSAQVSFDPCAVKLVQFREITIFFAISLVLFALLWFTILQLIKVREEIRLLSKPKRDAFAT